MERAEASLVITFECPYCDLCDNMDPEEFADYEASDGDVIWTCAGCGEDFIIPDIM